MGDIQITATVSVPSDKKLWLLEITGVNQDKFYSPKTGVLLKRTANDYWFCSSECSKRKFYLASYDENEAKNYNWKFYKIKEMPFSEEDIAYNFRLFGNEHYAPTMDALRELMQKEIVGCDHKIEQCLKAKEAFKVILKELEGL